MSPVLLLLEEVPLLGGSVFCADPELELGPGPGIPLGLRYVTTVVVVAAVIVVVSSTPDDAMAIGVWVGTTPPVVYARTYEISKYASS